MLESADRVGSRQLLVERLATWFGVEALAGRFPSNGSHPPYPLVGIVLCANFGIGNTVRQLLTGSAL
ncbi:hypothetical protein ACFSBJ_05525 [Haloplanus ruber]|uniref:Uncharacterized protein n=1 Tax=Haloplanus ruber TaxID=869892 RepID=A0ABD6CVC6_9EURY